MWKVWKFDPAVAGGNGELEQFLFNLSENRGKNNGIERRCAISIQARRLISDDARI
jgi:hypothetical protein